MVVLDETFHGVRELGYRVVRVVHRREGKDKRMKGEARGNIGNEREKYGYPDTIRWDRID